MAEYEYIDYGYDLLPIDEEPIGYEEFCDRLEDSDALSLS